MRFEYDREKSAANKTSSLSNLKNRSEKVTLLQPISFRSDRLLKHGIDFDAAQILWDDPERVEIPARELDEPRYLVIGKIEGKHWSAVMTHRNENIRLISVRRSRKEEVEYYEGF